MTLTVEVLIKCSKSDCDVVQGSVMVLTTRSDIKPANVETKVLSKRGGLKKRMKHIRLLSVLASSALSVMLQTITTSNSMSRRLDAIVSGELQVDLAHEVILFNVINCIYRCIYECICVVSYAVCFASSLKGVVWVGCVRAMLWIWTLCCDGATHTRRRSDLCCRSFPLFICSFDIHGCKF